MHNNYNLVAVDFDPFEGNAIEKVIITNEPQREVWLSCILGGDEASLAYNESVSLELKGSFNAAAFESALRDLISRHEGLRSVISKSGEHLIIYEECAIDICRKDFAAKNISDGRALVSELMENEMSKPFDLYNGPLYRFYIHKFSDNSHYFSIIIHHLIGDGWSIGVILEDLSLLYNAYSSGFQPNLVPAEQISDYAKEQIAFSQTEDYEITTNFWVDQFKHNVPILDLPLDFNRPAVRTYSGKRNDYTLSAELTGKIKQLAAKTGSSLVVTILTAFEVLLQHRSGQTDIVVGLPSAGQLATGNLGLVGHCVNLLPLRSLVDPDKSFIHYLIQRRSEIFDAYDHQRLTFSELIKKLNLKRDRSRVPLVPVVFNVDMGMDEKVKFNDLQHQLISNPRKSQPFDITLNVNGSKNALVFEWAYNTQLFTSATIDEMMQEFEHLLKRISTSPDVFIKDAIVNSVPFPLFSKAEADFPKGKTIANLFSDQVMKTPQYVAVEFEGEQLTYQQLDKASNQLANYLIAKGAEKQSVIPICINRSLQMIIGILGIIKAGAAYVPIDPLHPIDRVTHMLSELQSTFIISNVKCGKNLPGELILLDSHLDRINSQPTAAPLVDINTDSLLYIIYTSGSTGKPKGVMVEHQSLVNYITAQTKYFGITDQENILQFSNFAFDASVEQIFLALLNGGCLVLMPEDLTTDIDSFSRFINKKKISHLHSTPSFLENISGDYSYPHLKRIVSAGEICKKSLAEKWAGKLNFYNKYGPTECTISALEYLCAPEQLDKLKVLPIGTAISNNTVYLLDEKLKPAKRGEIYIGGIQVARGYFNRPELTAQSFIDNPFKPGERLYKTGDLGKWNSNQEIEFLGRIDDQVKIRGYRIEIGEIESVLSAYDNVSQCVVTTVDDEHTGKRLIAYVVPKGSFDKEFIRQALLLKLPEYMVPRVIVSIDRIPLTNNGKVDKDELKQIEEALESEKNNFIPAETYEQKLLANVWTEQLGIQNISITDDFFELGGHSLIAVKVMNIIEKKTGRRLPLATLFENSTIEKLAQMIRADEKEIKWDSLVAIKKSGNKMPIYLIHGAGLNVLVFNPLGRFMDNEQPVYGMQALGLNGKTELLYSMEELADRYNAEILDNDPIGPYALAGYSFGGLLAYEMARKLMAMGKEVKMLGILDTFAGNRDLTYKRSYKFFKKITRQFQKVLFFGKLFITNPKETYHYQSLVIKRKIDELFNRETKDTEEAFTYEKEINRSYDIASQNYFMTPLDIQVDLFRVKKRVYFLDDPVYLGWSEYAMKGVNVHDVPGDHKTFLFAPNDKEFAEILQKVLDSKLDAEL